MSRQMTWRQLLKLCQEHGREKVLGVMERQQRATEGTAANAWAEPHLHRMAQRLDLAALKQLETIIRLRNLTDDNITRLLKPAARVREARRR